MGNEVIVTSNQSNDMSLVSTSLFDKEGMNQLFKVATFFSKSNIVPEMYQRSPENCLVACEMAARMGVSPMLIMQNLYVVKGKPSWSGQACVSMINSSNRFSGSLEFVYTGEKVKPSYGCYAQAHRFSDGKLIKGTEITMQMVNDEGWGKNSKWRTMTDQMLAYRAASFFARLHCPDVLMGLQTADEVTDVFGEEPKKKTVLNLDAM